MCKNLYSITDTLDFLCPVCNKSVGDFNYSWIEYLGEDLEVFVIKIHTKCFKLIATDKLYKELCFKNMCQENICYGCKTRYAYSHYTVGNLDKNYNGYKNFCINCFNKFIGKYWCFE